MYHIFCIHSSVVWHLSSFQLLAIINNVATNIVEYVSLLHVGASSGFMSRSGIAASSGSTMSNFFEEPPNWFPELYQHAIPPPVEECSSSSTSLPASAVTWIINLSLSDWCEVEYEGCFDLHFLVIKDVEHFFKCFSALWYSSVENFCLALYPIF